MTVDVAQVDNKQLRLGVFLSPLLPSLMWKAYAVIVAPITMALIFVAGIPLLDAFRKRGWIRWWHAMVAGAALAVAAAMMYWTSADSIHLALAGPSNTIFIVAYGVGVGLAFWLIAIWRNPSFPQMAPNWFILVIVVVLIASGSFYSTSRLEVSEVYGIVTGPSNPNGSSLSIPVRLNDGNTALARMGRGLDGRVKVGQEVAMHTRLATTSDSRLYWLSGVCRDGGKDRLC